MLSPVLALVLSAPALPQAGTGFGHAVSSADVNGDGFSDLLVGEPFFGGAAGLGRVLVYPGSASGPAASPSWTKSGSQAGGHFGQSVAGVGDVNGDGFEDVAIGAPDWDAPPRTILAGPGAVRPTEPFLDSGGVTVFLGSPAGLANAPLFVRLGIQGDEHLGASLARAGDVNADGFDDVLVGATGTNHEAGAAFLFAGAAGGPSSVPTWVSRGLFPGGHFGRALSGGADVNGDGFDDVLIGAPDELTGTAYLFRGRASGLPLVASWTLGYPDGGVAPPFYGESNWGAGVALVGDQDGDGRAEILVSNPTFDGAGGHGSGGIADVGVLRLFRGSAGGVGALAVEYYNDGLSHLGAAVAAAGDWNGDGLSDLVATHDSLLHCVPGAATSFWGPVSDRFAALGTGFGQGLVAAAGDVDGDGFDDLVYGERAQDRIRVLRGGPGGLETLPSWTIVRP